VIRLDRDKEETAMENSQPVTVIIAFRLEPGAEERWLETLKGLRDQVLRLPTCRHFHLLRNRHDPAHRVVLTEWNIASDFDSFARETGLVWVSRGLECVSQPEYSIFETIPVETDEAIRSAVCEPVTARH